MKKINLDKNWGTVIKSINKNPSKGAGHAQDKFALHLIGNDGTFLDLGCAHPTHHNNSYLLEKKGWTGILIDLVPEVINECKKQRKNPAFCVNVIDEKPFIKILDENIDKTIDYISLDVDDLSGQSFTLECIKILINNGYGFKCMTFEHNFHKRGGGNYKPQKENEPYNLRDESRKLLHENGYKMLFSNVHNDTNKYSSWEDWWIDPNEFPDKIFKYSLDNKHFKKCINNLIKYK